jgi:hypothetical protein
VSFVSLRSFDPQTDNTVFEAAMGYNRTACFAFVTNLMSNDTSYTSRHQKYFVPGSSREFPKLTLDGCNVLCSRSWGEYIDSGPRLLSWILPAVLLVANIHFPPIGKRRFFLMLHILGDPIGAVYFHLRTIKLWGHCYLEAGSFLTELRPHITTADDNTSQNPITVVFAASARFMEVPGLSSAFQTAMASILDKKRSTNDRRARLHALCKAGSSLADLQINDIRRTLFAVLSYIFGIVAVFVPSMGGEPSPSGGRVSPAMLLIWIIPLVLLSNAIGDTTSWRQSEMILSSLIEEMGAFGEGDEVAVPETHDLEVLNRATIAPIFSQQRLPSETFIRRNTSHGQRAILAACSTIPVFIAFTIAFAVDDTPPTYFSCRALFNIGTITVWCISGAITALLIHWRTKLDEWLSIIVLTKDFVIGAPIVTLIAVSSCGYFNSCYCSSGVIWSRQSAHVELKPDWGHPHNSLVYRAAVTTGICAEVLFFLAVLMVWRRAFQAIWWTNTEGAHALAKLMPKVLQTEGKSGTMITEMEVSIKQSK